MANLNYSVALNLVTKGFNKGAQAIKTEMKSLQNRFVAFGSMIGVSAIGLNQFVQNIIEVSKETSKAQARLKVASGSMADFSKNLSFVNEVASKTGQYINDVTTSYASFAQAAKASGYSTKEAQKMYEDLSTSMAGLKLPAEDQATVLQSVQKMMIKGKITTRDFMLVVGKQMPQAFEALANVTGKSIGQIKKEITKGKLGADLLPAMFANLKLKVPEPDLSTLGALQNRLKNAMQKVYNNPDVVAGIKKVFEQLGTFAEWASRNMKMVFQSLITVVTAVMAGKLYNTFSAAFANMKNAAGSSASAFKMAWGKAVTAVKGFLRSIAPMLIIGAIVEIIQKIAEVRAAVVKARADMLNLNSETERAGNTQQVQSLKKELAIVNNVNAKLADRKAALADINKQLGTNYRIDNASLGLNAKINKNIRDRIKLLEAAAKVQYLAGKEEEVLSQRDTIKNNAMAELGISSKEFDEMYADYVANIPANTFIHAHPSSRNWYGGVSGTIQDAVNKPGWYGMGMKGTALDALRDYGNNNNLLIATRQKLRSNEAIVGNSKPIEPTKEDFTIPDDKKDKKHHETELERAEEEYTKSLNELKFDLSKGQITQKEYDVALSKLVYETLKKVQSDKDTKGSKFQKDLETYYNAHPYNKNDEELDKIKTDYQKSIDNAKTKLDLGIITESEYRDSLQESRKSAANAATSMDEVTDAAKDYAKKLMEGVDKKFDPFPLQQNRDTSFDYNKSKSEIASDNLENAKSNIATLQQYIDKHRSDLNASIDEAQRQLNDLEKSVPDLEKAMKLEKIKEDLKDIKKQASGFRIAEGTVSAMASLYSTAKGLRETLASKDSTMLDKVFASLDAAMSAVNTIQQLVDMINEFQKARKALQAVEKAAAAADTTNTVTEVANSEAKTAANAGEAASGAMKAHSSIPFVGIALGLAGVAAIIAAIASAKKRYATGGIIGGSSNTGDNMLARVNAGEMILNPSQQSRLFAIANGASAGNTQAPLIVSHKIKGSDLYLAIENYKHINKR